MDTTVSVMTNNENLNMVSGEARVEDLPLISEEQKISLRIVGQDGSEIYFKVKKSIIMERIFKAYCSRKGVSESSVRFLYDGARISESSSALQIGLEDGDVIDVMVQQTGGK